MALSPIRTVTGRGVVIPGDDIDTDRIIPARFMKCVTFDGLGEYLFHDARFAEDGTPRGHPLDDPRFAGASIIISGSNFGCGSSREHAPQAIYRAGFRAVIAESFAEIFFGNATILGMPCVQLERPALTALAQQLEANPATVLTLDLEQQQLSAGEARYPLFVAPAAREAFLSGRYDPIQDLLDADEQIDATAATLPYLQPSARG